MILRCYSIFDRKGLIYHPPFYQATDGMAVRAMTDAANDANSAFNKHPNDYVLYCVGEYDDQKGALIPCSPLVHVVDVIACVQASSPLPFPDAPKL